MQLIDNNWEEHAWNKKIDLLNAFISTEKDYLQHFELANLETTCRNLRWRNYCGFSFGVYKPFNHLTSFWSNNLSTLQAYPSGYGTNKVGKLGCFIGK